MKNLNENALMQEMNENEMTNVNGGWVLVGFLLELAWYCFDNRDDIKAGLADGAAAGNARF